MTDLRFDVEVPTCREGVFVPPGFASPHEVIQCIQTAERLGYNAVWATDFMTASPVSGVPQGERPAWFEPIVTLAYAAAVTERVKLGTGVIVLPYRDPVILAKQAATLDRLSNGRFLLGVGLGAWRDEIASVAAWRARPHRGAMLTEFAAVLRRLLDPAEESVTYTGDYVAIRDVDLQPKPIQAPLPTYMPGRSDAALMRIAQSGDGLMMLGTQIRQRLDVLEEVLAAHGRTIDEIDAVAEGELHLGPTREAAVAGYRDTRMGWYRTHLGMFDDIVANNWIGTVEDVVEALGTLRSQGISHFNVLHIAADTLAQRLELMHQFAEEVVPQVA